MKKVLALLLAATMTVGLVACGSKEAAPDETKTPAATEETADKADEAMIRLQEMYRTTKLVFPSWS